MTSIVTVPKTFSVEFVTPEKRVLSGEASFVVVPAYEGSLGVLPGHAPLLAQLVPGAVRIKGEEEETHFAVSGGLVEVRREGVNIFAESAELAEEIDVEAARQEAEKAKTELMGARKDPEIDVFKVEMALRAALARLRVAQTVRRKSPPHQSA